MDAADPLLLIEAMRRVTDGDLSPNEATHFYHDGLARKGIATLRPADADSLVTESVLLERAA